MDLYTDEEGYLIDNKTGNKIIENNKPALITDKYPGLKEQVENDMKNKNIDF